MMRDTHGELMIVNQLTIWMSIRILLKASKRRKVIGLTRRWHEQPTSGLPEGSSYNFVILRHICGFKVYIDGSI